MIDKNGSMKWTLLDDHAHVEIKGEHTNVKEIEEMQT